MESSCKTNHSCPSEALADDVIQAKIQELNSAWTLVDEDFKKIRREFKFKNFAEAHEFVGKIAALAEADNHHPDINYGWGYAVITFYTHNAGGLTEMDFASAAKIDVIASASEAIQK